MGAHKSLKLKKRLGKEMNNNKNMPNWFRLKTGSTIRYNNKRRHWRRTKLGL